MATSGSIDFLLTRDNIITEALELLGVLPEGVSPTAAQLTSCARTLNAMVKGWQARGTHLFGIQRTYLFLDKADREYTLHNTASSSNEYTTSFYATAINGAVESTNTTITVDDGTNISNSDRIGILTSNNDMHWTTVSSGGGSTTIVLTADDESYDFNDGAVVYTYTTKAARPRKILSAQYHEKPSSTFGFHDAVDGNTQEVDIIARTDYHRLSDKATGGDVNQIYYDPQYPSARLSVWPAPDVGGDYLTLFVERQLEDFDAASDDMDFPSEWSWALASNLALYLAPKFGVSDRTFNRINLLAQQALFDAESGDREGYMIFEPDRHG